MPRGELSVRALRSVEPDLRAKADALVDRLVARGTFDAVGDLARPYTVSVVADLVGLPEEGRSRLLAGSNAGFDRFGPAEPALPGRGARIPAAAGLRADGGRALAASTRTASARGSTQRQGTATSIHASVRA